MSALCAPASSDASDPQNLLALRRAAPAPARTTSSRQNWPPGPRSARAVAPNISVTPQPPRRGQPTPHQYAWARATARLASQHMGLYCGAARTAPRRVPFWRHARGCRAGTSPMPVARQTQCALSKHPTLLRTTLGAQQAYSAPAAVRSGAQRTVRHRDAHTPHPSGCGATRGAVRARRRSRGRSRGQSARSCQVVIRAWQWCTARCAAGRSARHCGSSTATRICRARLRAARQAAQRAPGAAALRMPAGGWAGHRWAAALVSTSSARA